MAHTWPGRHPPDAARPGDWTALCSRGRKQARWGVVGDQPKPQASDEQNISETVEGIWLGSKYAVLDKEPSPSLMTWQSKACRDGSGPSGKMSATEKAGAKRNGRTGHKPGGRLGWKCGVLAPWAGAGRWRWCLREDPYASSVERAANDSDGSWYTCKADKQSLTSGPRLVLGDQKLHCTLSQWQPWCGSCGWRSYLGCLQMPGSAEAGPWTQRVEEAAHSGTETRDLGCHPWEQDIVSPSGQRRAGAGQGRCG